MMQDQPSLTLCWRSFLGGASDLITAIFAHEGGQNFDYSLISSHSCLIIHEASTENVDTQVTLIFER